MLNDMEKKYYIIKTYGSDKILPNIVASFTSFENAKKFAESLNSEEEKETYFILTKV
jgi:hypothetical protein